MSLAAPLPPAATRSSSTTMAAVEWPTLLLLFGLFAAWGTLTWFHADLPAWIVYPLGAVILTWHSSTQHEIVHGHPTRWPSVNHFLGVVPLSLWVPFERYRETHLTHHIDERLTDPYDDPETYYWTRADWAGLGPLGRALVRAQSTLLGRLTIGPFWNIARWFWSEGRRVIDGAPNARWIWVEHLLWCVPVVAWVTAACGMSIWAYVFGMVIPGTALLMVRSFAEHRARDAVRQRTAIVENARFFGPLFLYNNLHSVHHENPGLPWYRYNAAYRANRDRLLRDNGGLLYNSYFDVARRYLLTPHDTPEHPTDRAPLPPAADRGT